MRCITHIKDKSDGSLFVTVSNLSVPGWPDYECEVSRSPLPPGEPECWAVRRYDQHGRQVALRLSEGGIGKALMLCPAMDPDSDDEE